MAVARSWPTPTPAERAHHRTAIFKDAILFSALVYALVRVADTLPELESDKDRTALLQQGSSLLPLLYALCIIVTLTKGDLTGLPPASKGEPKWDSISTPLGHFAYFTLQSLFHQTAYLCIKAYGIYTANTKLLVLCLRLSLWTNTQGIALTILFFKLNWFETKWIRDVKIPLEKKFPGISMIWLLGHVPSLPLGVIDAWTTDPHLIATYGTSLSTVIKVAFTYGTVYLLWMKFLQWYTGGTCIYPFVKDLNTVPKCIGFAVVVGAAVSGMAYAVNYITLS